MILFSGTKINLGLRITRKRTDGFHDIETVFYPLPYGDILEAVAADTFSFKASGLQIPGREADNLVVKAMHLLQKEYDVAPVSVHLHKVVPMGTGLGGGSANAAAMLTLLNTIHRLNLSGEEMRQLAATLGADCAFFLSNTAAYATGKGDQLTPLPLDFSNYRFALVIPDVRISTQEAYRQCQPATPATSLKEIVRQPVEQWKDHMVNDFEDLPLVPDVIHQIKEELYAAGALYAAMSGSGSAVFGIFREHTTLDFPGADKVVWV